MPSSSHPDRTRDDRWKSAFQIIEKAQHVPPANRRRFAESETDDPKILELIFEVLDDDEAGPRADDRLPQIGEQIGRYKIVAKQGEGGMGLVYSAHDVELDRTVALKFVSNEVLADKAAVDRLVREAKAASALNHPHIITVYDVIRTGTRAAIAMELVDGVSLRQYCTSAQPASKVIRWGRQIASALAATHEKGIVHRDIKPENVMIRKGDYAKVVDFGVARQTAEGARTNASFRHGGTINYFSPEQARGERATPASDVFALGTVLYELAAGVHPFRCESPFETLHAINHRDPPSLAHEAGVPSKLSSLIAGMGAKDAAARPSAAEVERQFDAIAEGQDIREHGVSKRHVWIAVGALAAITVAGGTWMLRARKPATPRPDDITRITALSSENRATAAALSPDATQLAYATLDGPIYIRGMSDGVERSIHGPERVMATRLAWFRDGSRLLLTGVTDQDHRDVAWVIPVSANAAPAKILENVKEVVPSPDGTRIAYLPDRAEVWVAQPDGESARLVRVGDGSTSFSGLMWSEDGARLACSMTVSSHNGESSYVSFDANTGRTVATLRGAKFLSATAVPGGRVLVLEGATSRDPSSQNLIWSFYISEIRTDPNTGEIRGPLRRLTSVIGPEADNFTASDAGTMATVILRSDRAGTYIADLIPGATPRLVNQRRLGWFDVPEFVHAWTADSRSVIFESMRWNRDGNDLFRQRILDHEAEPLVTTPGNEWLPQVSPDGRWVLYRSDRVGRAAVVMRVPASGGTPEQLVGDDTPGEFRCSISAAGRCVLRVKRDEQFVFYHLDPVTGVGRELSRTALYQPITGDWDISPDGSEVAIPGHDPLDAKIRVVSLTGTHPEETVVIKGQKDLVGLIWTADGRGWYIKLRLVEGLYFADRNGDATPVAGSLNAGFAVPSPDGRHVALANRMHIGNVYTIGLGPRR